MKKETTFQDIDFYNMLNETLSLIQCESIEFKEHWHSIRYEIEDLINEGVLVLFKCLKLYTKEKKYFRGYLKISLRNCFKKLARKDGITKEGERIEENETREKFFPAKGRLSFAYLDRSTRIERPIFLNGLSRKAKMFINIALEIPDGLISWMSEKPRTTYYRCVGYYLNMNNEEIEEIKTELEKKLL